MELAEDDGFREELNPSYGLMENLFIGAAARHADRVVIDVHQVL
jgi:hypothetical protein